MKDEEINNLKQKNANEIISLKEELGEDIPGCVGSNLASPVDASSAQAVTGTNLPHSSGSAHDSVLQKEFCISHSLLLVCILLSISKVVVIPCIIGFPFSLYGCGMILVVLYSDIIILLRIGKRF
ncbi:hypothetical protein RDI58_000988 [Solanum bulbocastanum]|uniref:Uncharacterized protein n=1 Tax=Solanum bulbocastanum TaxID=147425 RepID=A0AAN8YPN4_SOLBU